MDKTSQTASRLIALGLAAFMSTAMLAGVDGLATQQSAVDKLAQDQQVQRVVITSQRLPRS